MEIHKKFSVMSERVKCVDFHPAEPWILASLYTGKIRVWNLESQKLIQSFEVCDLPVRAAKFVARSGWIVSGSDDFRVRVFNSNTSEIIKDFEAHSDFVRSLAVHPDKSFILTAGDDGKIKLWDWDKDWACIQVFEGHTHYVMQIVINPKDDNQFASASLDRTIKVWQIGSTTPNLTLEGHEKSANCVDFYPRGDKQLLVSGSDDNCIKVWDYQNTTCLQTLKSHSHNVSDVVYHPTLPIIVSGSEDGNVCLVNANSYNLETKIDIGQGRVWQVACKKTSSDLALGCDNGIVVIQLQKKTGTETPETGSPIAQNEGCKEKEN